jgi:hypothetical protein
MVRLATMIDWDHWAVQGARIRSGTCSMSSRWPGICCRGANVFAFLAECRDRLSAEAMFADLFPVGAGLAECAGALQVHSGWLTVTAGSSRPTRLPLKVRLDRAFKLVHLGYPA